MKEVDIEYAIEDILQRMVETEQDSLERVFKRMCLHRGMIADFDRIRCDNISKFEREYFYVPLKKGAMYFLMKVTVNFTKVFSMNIDYNPELVKDNEL